MTEATSSALPRLTTIEDVLTEMRARWEALDRAGDCRAVFAASYLATTEEVHRACLEGRFRDPEWVVRIDCDFALRYFAAFDAYERGERCPEPWRVAFEAACSGRTLAIQDLALGMNAHIAYDLPLALDATIERDASPALLAHRRADHEELNRVLADAIDPVQRRAAWAYDPLLAAADLLLLRVDETIAASTIRAWRTHVWEQFLALRAARERARGELEARLENDTGQLARMLVAPQRVVPRLCLSIAAYRRLAALARRGVREGRELALAW
jgi:hypothetical protein